MYIIGYMGNIYELPCGSLCGGDSASTCMDQSDNIPTYEEIGCFADGDPKAMSLGQAPACDTMNAEVGFGWVVLGWGLDWVRLDWVRLDFGFIFGFILDWVGLGWLDWVRSVWLYGSLRLRTMPRPQFARSNLNFAACLST